MDALDEYIKSTERWIVACAVASVFVGYGYAALYLYCGQLGVGVALTAITTVIAAILWDIVATIDDHGNA